MSRRQQAFRSTLMVARPRPRPAICDLSRNRTDRGSGQWILDHRIRRGGGQLSGSRADHLGRRDRSERDSGGGNDAIRLFVQGGITYYQSETIRRSPFPTPPASLLKAAMATTPSPSTIRAAIRAAAGITFNGGSPTSARATPLSSRGMGHKTRPTPPTAPPLATGPLLSEARRFRSPVSNRSISTTSVTSRSICRTRTMW